VDLLLYAFENDIKWEEVSLVLGLNKEQIERVFKDFKAKEQASWHLRQLAPTL
jgi:hypothetical protein